MTKPELIEKLKECEWNGDLENAHVDADMLLLEYINDEEIKNAFEKVDKWYA